MRRNFILTAALALMALFIISGCSGQPLSTREKGTFIGTGVGAATGAIIGAALEFAILGDSFCKNYVTIFDYSHGTRVGFLKSVDKY